MNGAEKLSDELVQAAIELFAVTGRFDIARTVWEEQAGKPEFEIESVNALPDGRLGVVFRFAPKQRFLPLGAAK